MDVFLVFQKILLEGKGGGGVGGGGPVLFQSITNLGILSHHKRYVVTLNILQYTWSLTITLYFTHKTYKNDPFIKR